MAIVTISGTPGSGKSTLGRLLAKRLGYAYHSIGELRRRFAAEKGVTIAELNRRSAAGEEDTDTAFDRFLASLGGQDRIVVDARLGFHFLPHSIKLFVDADERVRAERLLARESIAERAATLAEAVRMNRERIASDQERYRKYYNLDPFRPEQYDLVLDSARKSPEELVEEVVTRFFTRTRGDAPRPGMKNQET